MAHRVGLEVSEKSFSQLLDDRDYDQRRHGHGNVLHRDCCSVEGVLHKCDVDRCEPQNHLEQESRIQGHVREAVAHQALPLCCGRDGRSDLAHHQGPIIHRLAFRVCQLLLLGVVLGVLALHEEIPDARCEEEHEPAEEALQHADVAVAVDTDSPVCQLDKLGVARGTGHEPGLCRLEGVRNSCPDVGSDVDQEHLGDGQSLWHSEHHGQRRSELGDLRAECVHDGFPQVGTAQSTLLDTVDDRGEVIVLQNDVRSILGDLGASDAHSDTNLGLLQGGSVVDSIASHGADVADAVVAVLLVGLHNDLLVNRRHPGEDTSMRHGLLPPDHVLLGLVVGEVVSLRHPALQLCPCDDVEVGVVTVHVGSLRKDVDALRNGTSSVGVISSDHDNLHAGVVGLDNSFRNALLRRILDAVEADEVEVLEREVAVFGSSSFELRRRRRDLPLGDCQHSTSVVHQLLHLALHLGLAGRVDGAELQNAVGSPLEDGGDLSARGLAVDREHPLVLRIERDLEYLRILGPGAQQLGCFGASLDLAGGAQDGDLGRRSRPEVGSIRILLQFGAVVKDATDRDGVANGGGGLRPVPVFPNDHFEPFTTNGLRGRLHHHQILRCHLALRECAGFVGAEDGDASQGLNSIDLSHENLSLHHLSRGEHQGDRHGGKEAFWHLGEESAGSVLDDVSQRSLLGHLHCQTENTDDDRNARDEVHEVLDLDFQGTLGSGRLDARGDLAQESLVADEEHHGSGIALHHSGAVEGQVSGLRRGGALLS
mmetsp:Transcript_78773/g.172782  ORF Transcript_78773/g.172782 Transcript_78773/m.172782 type:complete len:766 (+) Transcript_78773:209-2506(+)